MKSLQMGERQSENLTWAFSSGELQSIKSSSELKSINCPNPDYTCLTWVPIGFIPKSNIKVDHTTLASENEIVKFICLLDEKLSLTTTL